MVDAHCQEKEEGSTPREGRALKIYIDLLKNHTLRGFRALQNTSFLPPPPQISINPSQNVVLERKITRNFSLTLSPKPLGKI